VAHVDDEDSAVLEDEQEMIDLLDNVSFLDAAHLVVGDRRISRLDSRAGDRERALLLSSLRGHALEIFFVTNRNDGVGLRSVRSRCLGEA
jgi:hypothetical protein